MPSAPSPPAKAPPAAAEPAEPAEPTAPSQPAVSSPKGPTPTGRKARLAVSILFFAAFFWTVTTLSVQVLSETVGLPQHVRSAPECRRELDQLRSRLESAKSPIEYEGESQRLRAFRQALGGPEGQAWDLRILELIDGCPAPESQAAYALARLRAAEEGMVRIDAQSMAPVRRAESRAQRALDATRTTPGPLNP